MCRVFRKDRGLQAKEFRSILKRVGEFSDTQRIKLIEALVKQKTQRKEVEELIDKVEEKPACPHCNGESVKNGKKRGLQRYQCKICRKSFNSLTGTPFSRLRMKEKWTKVYSGFEQGETLLEMAERLDICVDTAFRWRHRFSKGLGGKGNPKLGGIVEADETFFRFSEKGKRSLDREPHKRGESSGVQGLSFDFVTVWIARDRNKETAHYVSRHRDYYFLKSFLKPIVQQDSILCTDGKKGYAKLSRKEALQHVVLNGPKVQGIYHINNVNNYHQRLKNWIDSLNGVATKYLQSYLEIFRFKSRLSEGLEYLNPVNLLKTAILTT